MKIKASTLIEIGLFAKTTGKLAIDILANKHKLDYTLRNISGWLSSYYRLELEGEKENILLFEKDIKQIFTD